MPFVNVRVIEGTFSAEQKQDMIRALTESMVLVIGEDLRCQTWVLIEEVKGADWAIGGEPVSNEGLARFAVL